MGCSTDCNWRETSLQDHLPWRCQTLLHIRFQSSPTTKIWRSRSRVIPYTSVHKIDEMELRARFSVSARFLFAVILDAVWQCWTLKRASFWMMRRCPCKMWPKQQGQWQRLLVVVLPWYLMYFVDVLLHQLSYHFYHQEKLFCCLVWLRINFQFPIGQLFLPILFHWQAETCTMRMVPPAILEQAGQLKDIVWGVSLICPQTTRGIILHLFSAFLLQEVGQTDEMEELQKDPCDARALVYLGTP